MNISKYVRTCLLWDAGGEAIQIAIRVVSVVVRGLVGRANNRKRIIN
jgi:hypothetical protein